MGRTAPSSEAHHKPPPPLLLLAACVAATIAIVAALCASHHRKSLTPKSQRQSPSPPSSNGSSAKAQAAKTSPPRPAPVPFEPPPPPQPPTSTADEKEELVLVDVATHGPIGPTMPARTTPRRKLSASFSVKIPEGLARIRTKKEKQEMAVQEESVWMKTIILGEKCKVPSDDEEEVVLYNEKGNRQRNYHPKTPRSLPVSRTSSFANAELVPSLDSVVPSSVGRE